MLDPLSALSLASAVIQFVDFGSKFFIDAYGSFKSAKGLTDDAVETQFLSESLETLSSRIVTQEHATPSQDTELIGLAKKCEAVASDLSQLLQDLSVNSDGIFRSWDAIRQTARRVWKKDQLKSLQQRLDIIRSHLNTHILEVLRDNQSALSRDIHGLLAMNKEMQSENKVLLNSLRNDVLRSVEKSRAEFETLRKIEQSKAIYGKFQKVDQQNVTYNVTIQNLESYSHDTASALESLRVGARTMATTNSILSTLTYTEMPHRHDDIRDAYPDTFGWIFNEHNTNFKTWLEGGSGIFWISGKAGSGKSTLMKFLDDQPQTRSTLETWAGGQTLVTGNFYFWSAGLPLQRTLRGLLQSLLFQVLRQVPDLIPQVCAQRWAADERAFAPTWTIKELLDTLEKVLLMQLPAKFCFFIDGLDEYDGEPGQLIEKVNSIAMSSSIKICVSSRPWTEFNDAYGKDGERLLVLQDLTRPDMRVFVEGQLDVNERFAQLSRRDPGAQDLIEEILAKAQGVFLWVFLVVRSLLRGLGKHDGISVLRERLDELPSDLEKYFQQIMKSIERVYQDRAARLLQLAVCAAPLPLTAVRYLEEEKPGFEPALEPADPVTEASIEELLERATSQVNAWCRDFLEVMIDKDALSRKNHLLCYRVGFLHRTVRDFMQTKDMQAWLNSHVQAEFDPWWSVVAVHVYQAQLLSSPSISCHESQFTEVVKLAIIYAREYEYHRQKAATALVNELDRVATLRNDKWTSRIFEDRQGDLVSVMVFAGLTHYVSDSLAQDKAPLSATAARSLLHTALPSNAQADGLRPRSAQTTHAMVKLLLASGADPNEKRFAPAHNSTPWHEFLAYCLSGPGLLRLDTTAAHSWALALLLLEHGAHTGVKVEVDGAPQKRQLGKRMSFARPEYVTVEQCLKCVCPKREVGQLAELIRAAAREPEAKKHRSSFWSSMKLRKSKA